MPSDSVSSHEREFTMPEGQASAAAVASRLITAGAGAEAPGSGSAGAGSPGLGSAGSEGGGDGRPVPEAPRGGERSRLAGGAVTRAVVRNPVFCGALVLAALLRVVVIAGYRPAILIRLDSYIYLVDSTRWTPDPDNPNGYPFFLWLLKPAHSLALIAGVQHLMGLGVAVLVYAILRRYRVPRWAATVAPLPTLFDPRQVLIEHSVMADTPAMTLMIAAFAVLLLPRKLSLWSTGIAGLLLGLSCIARPTALPLIVFTAVFLLLTRAGWVKTVAVLVAGALPVVSYAAWFSLTYGVFNLTNSNGLFLWARTMTFANCAVIKPPPDLLPLCPERNPGVVGKLRPDPYSWRTLLRQQNPQDFLWSRRDWQWQPRPPGYEPYQVAFTPERNARAQRFALRAITAQPMDYATVVAEGIAFTFLKTDRAWQFRPSRAAPARLHGTTAYELNAVKAYTGGTAGVAPYLGHHIVTRSRPPYSSVISRYQRVVFLPGVLFAALFAVGFAGIVIRRRRMGAALLLWTSAVVVLVLPIAENQYNYRYALAAVPLVAMSVALLFADRRDTATGVGGDAAVPDETPAAGRGVPAPSGSAGGVVPAPPGGADGAVPAPPGAVDPESSSA